MSLVLHQFVQVQCNVIINALLNSLLKYTLMLSQLLWPRLFNLISDEKVQPLFCSNNSIQFLSCILSCPLKEKDIEKYKLQSYSKMNLKFKKLYDISSRKLFKLSKSLTQNHEKLVKLSTNEIML